ncbi:osmoprotectant transport system substrate-binding protein [Nakamurella panacisegetis]|uniref:Osmoprotectant transport system substrate-binding protein n=1 Tax=Nakamurella panacisegetis TaxID=1090615 RepID=A0A1H0P7F2_9ACTN|nr:glycine betaine ABC transporter substrate-binding protein [Nakamurella panacisegetis]SDP00913.1 osmoprotectant transport system substrate-binding protein [Nakamurella panacisegetis]
MTTRRRIWTALAAGMAVVLTVTACQVDGSASPDPAAVVALQSGSATSSAASSPGPAESSGPAPSSSAGPASTATQPPTTIEDRSTSVGPSSDVPTTSTSASGPTLVFADDGYAASVVVVTTWARALVAKGFRVGIRTIDQEATQVAALKAGQIDLALQYNTELLEYLDAASDAVTQADVDAAIATKLPTGLSVLRSTAAKDDGQLAVSAATAAQYKLHSISDLADHVGDITLLLPATNGTKFARGLTDYYGLTFASTKVADWGGPKTIAAIKSSAAVGPMAASQWQIDANKFVTLTDPKHLFFTENFIPLVGQTITPAMRITLNAVSAKLSIAAVRGMRQQLSAGGEPSDIADAWLASVGLG